MRNSIPSLFCVVGLVVGCRAGSVSNAPDDATTVPPDAWATSPDSTDGNDAFAYDVGVDVSPSGLPACNIDAECGEAGFCDEGICAIAPDMPFAEPAADGVTRAAAAAFDIAPSYLEHWIDRADEGCPGNAPGRFDGRLDLPRPDDPCFDGFDDANGNGVFDAVWLGGGRGARAARGVDNENPPAGRTLVLARDDAIWILLTLDVYAVDAARVHALTRWLAVRLGIPAHAIAVHATGARSGPDAVGLWGPTLATAPGSRADSLRQRAAGALDLLDSVPIQSGVDEAWWHEVRRRALAAVRESGRRLRPVEVRSTRTRLPIEPASPLDGVLLLPDADGDAVLNDASDRNAWLARPQWLSRDRRWPDQRDAHVRAVALYAAADNTPVAVLFGWGAAPAAGGSKSIGGPVLSAGFPGVARAWLEAAMPGAVAIWLTTAADDSVEAGGDDVFVPEVDDDGVLLDVNGDPATSRGATAAAEDPTRALGTLIAAAAYEALTAADPSQAALELSARFAWTPVTNPRYGIAARLGVLTPFDRWLTGRTATSAWSSGDETPACGGLGCLRHRLDRIVLGTLTLVTVPGALDDAYVHGRLAAEMPFGDARGLIDLDGDGVPDIEDPEIRLMSDAMGRTQAVEIAGPANPQQFDAIEGLQTDDIWIVGRTNGGIGSLRPAGEHINVFEGQLDGLADYVTDEINADTDLCQIGYPCTGSLTLGELVDRTTEAQPQVLADIAGTHEVWLVSTVFDATAAEVEWRVETGDGSVRARGNDLELGPDNRAFALSVDLAGAGVVRSDWLVLPAGNPEPPDPEEDGDGPQPEGGAASAQYEIGGIVPVVLRDHPNTGDAWSAMSADQGDLVYNATCELIFGGACPHRRPVEGDDPNQVLPRAP